MYLVKTILHLIQVWFGKIRFIRVSSELVSEKIGDQGQIFGKKWDFGVNFWE
jgi:hypothetical protein